MIFTGRLGSLAMPPPGIVMHADQTCPGSHIYIIRNEGNASEGEMKKISESDFTKTSLIMAFNMLHKLSIVSQRVYPPTGGFKNPFRNNK